MTYDVATLGGGCFWCTEAVFDQVEGVKDVMPGYAGGQVEEPSYQAVCGGATGHAEVVQVTFDPAVIPYAEILRIFFGTHDPTTKDRQGADVGSQYRSTIMTHRPDQAETARAVIAELEAEGVFDAPIVTEVVPAARFWPAEGYHQDYFAKNPAQPYCAAVVGPKVAKFRARFRDRLKP